MPDPQTQPVDPLDAAIAEIQASIPEASPSAGVEAPSPGAPNATGGGQAPVSQAPGDHVTGFTSFAHGVGDAVTFGTLDELGGVVDSLVPTQGRDNVFSSDQSFGTILAGNIAKNRAVLKQEGQDFGGSQLAGQLVGGLAIPFGAGARGALQVAKVGAVQGAVYGLGSGEGVEDRVEKGALGGVVGGVVGAALGKAVEAGGALLGKLTGKAAEEVAPPPTITAEPSSRPIGAGTRDGQEVPVLAQEDPSPEYLAEYQKRFDAGAPADELHAFAKENGQQVSGVEEAVKYRDAGGKGSKITAKADTEEQVPLVAEPGYGINTQAQQVGTIGRSELDTLTADVEKFRARVKGGEDRAPDVTATSPEKPAVGEFRLGNLGDGEDTASLLGALVRQLPSAGRRSDEELMQTAHAAAADIGEDPEAMLALGRQIAGTLGDADGAMAALRTVWSGASGQVSKLFDSSINWAEADDMLVAHAGESIRNLSLLSQMVQQAKVGLGRGLRVNSLPDAATYLKTLATKAEAGAADAVPVGPVTNPRELPPLPRNREEIQNWMDLWGMVKNNPKGQADFLQGTLSIPSPGKYLRTSVANLFTASILSAPRTVAMNIVGPAFISGVRNMERMGGAAAMALNPLASAEERAAARAVARETPTAFIRTLGDIGDVFHYAMQAAENNHSVLGGGSSSTDALASYGPLTDNLLGAAGADPSMMYSLGNLINVFPKAFGRLNNGLDEMSKRLAYQGEVRVRAQVEARMQGITGEDAAEFVRNKLKASFDEAGHATDQQMLRSAERTTFTAQVGDEGGWVRRFGNGMQALRRDIPETRFLVPVFNVPANALGETLRRLPITRLPGASHLFPTTAADLAGENGVVAQADAHGRFMLGAAFLTAGVMLNRTGVITGAGPQEVTDRRVWLQTHQPYSIRVGDEWVRYDKFDILGGLLSIPATIADATVYRAADKGVSDMMFSGAGALGQWFKDRAALRNAVGLLSLGDDPTKDTGNFVRQFAGSISQGFVPAAVRTLTVDTTDPYVRMRRSWGDYMKAALPGLSQTLEPTRNVLGEPIERSADTFGEAVIPVTMQSAVTYADDPVMDELGRLYDTTGYGAGADPKSLGYGYFNPKDVKLEDGRSLYDRAMQKRMTMEIEGKTLKQTLRATFDSEEYNSAVDADPMQKKTSLGDLSRGYLTKKVFDTFNKAAKAELALESPTADAYLTAAAAKQRDDAYLQDLSVEDLVATPRLYRDRGIDSAAYSDKIKGSEVGDPLLQALGL